MFCIVACEKKSPIDDDKNKLPEYLDVDVTFSRGQIYKQSDNPECPQWPDIPKVFEYSMMTYITLESLYGQNRNDYKEKDDSIYLTLPHKFMYRIKREEDRVFDFDIYWMPGCRTLYYFCLTVRIQGFIVEDDSLYLNGAGYHSRLPYYKEDFEKLKNGKWTGIYH